MRVLHSQTPFVHSRWHDTFLGTGAQAKCESIVVAAYVPHHRGL